MRGGLKRGLAETIGRLLRHLHPARHADWARAMRGEIEQVEDDGEALAFALGCFWTACRAAAVDGLWYREGDGMTIFNRIRLGEPQAAGIACALAATVLGLVYLVAAGAPARYVVVNAAAFLLGVVALGGLGAAGARLDRHSGVLLILLGACLLATALFGTAADGASRWIQVGPLGVQVSLVLLPFMILTFARAPGPAGALGMAVAAAALALQPDRAMAGVLAFGMAVLAITRPGRWTLGSLAAAVAAFLVALARPDSAPAVPFVDQILFTAFDLHLLVGVAVLLGAGLLLVPAAVGLRSDPANSHVHLVLGTVWLGCIGSAALGNYPTPVVGYGGSAILGYLLSLASLPPGVRAADGEAPAAPEEQRAKLTGVTSASLA